MSRFSLGTSRTRTPIGSRVPLTESEMVQVATMHGIRFWRVGQTGIIAIAPVSDREPPRDGYELSVVEAARYVFHQFKYNGDPVLQPYVSSDPAYASRMGFRWGPAPGAQSYKRESRALRAAWGGSRRSVGRRGRRGSR